jgi:DeoR/GlpR family transcriptional regulator of sugar metabolism
MLARQRQTLILERVRAEGGVRVIELARALGVSDMTVRRDLELLHDRGLIEKVHGGAASIPRSAVPEPVFDTHSNVREPEQEAIAAAAVRLIVPGTAIGLSAGSTTYALARRLVDIPGLTVVTNAIPVADILHRTGRSDETIILTGGVRTQADALVGPLAVAALRSIHLDLVFMSVHGMDLRSGFTTRNVLEADTDRALVASGRRLVVLADSSKWGVIGISSIARLDEADTLVTDPGLSADARQLVGEQVREVVIAPVGNANRPA